MLLLPAFSVFVVAFSDLVLTARRLETLQALAGELTAAYPARRVEVYALDVRDDDAVAKTVEDAAAALGGLDVVVANAGVGGGFGWDPTGRVNLARG